MSTLSRFNLSPLSRRARTFGAIASALLLSFSSSTLLAQNAAEEASKRRRASADESGRRGGSAEDMQGRLLASLRERLEVPDDEEWKIISERLGKVIEARRNVGGPTAGIGGFAGRGQQGGGDGNRGRGPRPGGSPEMAALQSAIRDKLPDAEIKSRLERLRENRKANEAKLSKAQEELRAVLSVRQEAVAVVFGLLP